MPPTVIDISARDMDALIERIDAALNDGLSLEPEDIRLVLQILRQFIDMQDKLEGDKTLKQRYLKLMGLVGSSESQDHLFGNGKKRPTSPRNKKNNADSDTAPSTPPTICHHELSDLEKGQACPECEAGRLYKAEPASFIRVVGQQPFSTERHVLEQLRCNLCGELFSASLPGDVQKDGPRNQKYGYSARALMAINKFYMGNPYYRQGSLQTLLGASISASTIYDQCALLVGDLQPIFTYIKVLAANAVHFNTDDTGNKIIDQKPIEKAKRNGKGTRQRSGVYTSALVAELASGQQVVLFQTNIGHAGEWLDEILAARSPELSPPLLMCDALSSNYPTVMAVILSLCNAHSRRKFVDIATLYPDEVETFITGYSKIWQHDTESKEQSMTPAERLAHHQEKSLPIMIAQKAWCEETLARPATEENSALGRAIKYFLKHYPRLIAFCGIEGAQIDNNLAEGFIKLIATGRKNAYFYKTLAGAEVGDVVTSLLATCETNNVNCFEYFVALQQNRFVAGRNPEQWLPWNYQEALTVVGAAV